MLSQNICGHAAVTLSSIDYKYHGPLLPVTMLRSNMYGRWQNWFRSLRFCLRLVLSGLSPKKVGEDIAATMVLKV
jgi:hypothetical protein